MKGKRYVKKYQGESKYSRNVREMIEMLQHEEVKTGKINYKILKMSRHATERVVDYFDCSEERAIKEVRFLLKHSKRVGEQLAYDGRINVMFVCNQYAIYLSPNLEHVITIHKFQQVSYNPIREILPELKAKFQGKELRQELVRLHKEAWATLEQREAEQLKVVLEIDREVKEQLNKLQSLRQGYSPRHYKRYVKDRIAEERERLFSEGEKLFSIKLEKRHIGKSITSVL